MKSQPQTGQPEPPSRFLTFWPCASVFLSLLLPPSSPPLFCSLLISLRFEHISYCLSFSPLTTSSPKSAALRTDSPTLSFATLIPTSPSFIISFAFSLPQDSKGICLAYNTALHIPITKKTKDKVKRYKYMFLHML